MEADVQSRTPVVPGWLQPALERGRIWAKAAATFGSPGSLAFAAVLGAAAFLAALSITPPPPAAATPAPKSSGPLTDVSLRPGSLAPVVGAPPPPVVQTVLDYEVTYFWPARPQTVDEPTAIRAGPAERSALIRTARPGERLRINGRVVDAPQGPWLRVRLADGGDGYIRGRTVDVAAFRQRRAAEAAEAAVAAATEADLAAAGGAPLLLPSPAIAEESELGPPSF